MHATNHDRDAFRFEKRNRARYTFTTDDHSTKSARFHPGDRAFDLRCASNLDEYRVFATEHITHRFRAFIVRDSCIGSARSKNCFHLIEETPDAFDIFLRALALIFRGAS